MTILLMTLELHLRPEGGWTVQSMPEVGRTYVAYAHQPTWPDGTPVIRDACGDPVERWAVDTIGSAADRAVIAQTFADRGGTYWHYVIERAEIDRVAYVAY